ncbi:class I SAM-dependent methyltransferase [Streptomyces sp. NPDC092296]|uniref:class I SAM-dependent methyltransferase n=1 Tax=Streptomyces sp. NPDC092296 TaxID=3366012 RepID=UPI0038014A58
MNTPPEYFTEMYRDADDPWGLGSRWYEQRKYAVTTASLPRRRYRSAFEPACSVGVLSALLADRCDRLLSCDRSERAVAAARHRLAGRPGVRVERLVLPADWPERRFDLIVLSEFLYYFGAADADDLLRRAVDSLEPGGTLLAVHWRRPVAEHAQQGEAVHRAVRAVPGLVRIAGHQEPDFLLDVLIRTGSPAEAGPESLSVAAAEGLA